MDLVSAKVTLDDWLIFDSSTIGFGVAVMNIAESKPCLKPWVPSGLVDFRTMNRVDSNTRKELWGSRERKELL